MKKILVCLILCSMLKVKAQTPCQFRLFPRLENVLRKKHSATSVVYPVIMGLSFLPRADFNDLSIRPSLAPQSANLGEEKLRKNLLLFFSLLSSALVVILGLFWKVYKDNKNMGKIEEKLRRATDALNAELKDSNAFYEMMLMVLAHDIRQPLSNIIMAKNLLQSGDIPNESLQEIWEISSNTAKDSLFFMDGLLGWMKSKRDGYEFIKETFPFGPLIKEANAFFIPLQRKKGVVIKCDFNPEALVFTNRMVLLFTIRNILNNATWHAPRKSTITVSGKFSDGAWITTIADEGKGMSEEEIDTIFRFAGKKSFASKNSAGVALAIASEMLARVNASINLESAVGEGAKFTIKIPN